MPAYKKISPSFTAFESQSECEQKTSQSCSFECRVASFSKQSTGNVCKSKGWVVINVENEKQEPYSKCGPLAKCISEDADDRTWDWKTYRNEEYGFSIALPPSWNSYRVNENPVNFKGVSFGIKDQDEVFSILVITKQEYSDCLKGNLCPIRFISQNNTSVFALAHAQDYNDGVRQTPGITGQAVWDSIISTFKFTK